jgi:zinc and cadmium transporter
MEEKRWAQARRWRHEHPYQDHQPVQPVGYVNLIADGVHNLVDGMLIGASYLAGLPVGIATTVAVILHAGFSRKRALLLNFSSGCLAIVGALLSLLTGSVVEEFTRVMLPFTAGGFIYIAGSDLLPELHKETKPLRSVLQLMVAAVGVGLMLLLAQLE